MKTRVVYPQMWLDEKFAECSVSTKLLFCYLINNPHLKLTPYLHITDRQIMFDTGLNTEQLRKGKDELQSLKWVFFADNWVFHHHKCAYVDYEGRDRVLSSKNEELASVPENIKETFKGLITGYEPVLNTKQEIINPKPERDVKRESEDRIVIYLTNPPEEDINQFHDKFIASATQVKQKAEDMLYWYKNLPPKRKKDYTDPQAILRNALRKDFGYREAKVEFVPEEAAPPISEDQRLRNIARLAEMKREKLGIN